MVYFKTMIKKDIQGKSTGCYWNSLRSIYVINKITHFTAT